MLAECMAIAVGNHWISESAQVATRPSLTAASLRLKKGLHQSAETSVAGDEVDGTGRR